MIPDITQLGLFGVYVGGKPLKECINLAIQKKAGI